MGDMLVRCLYRVVPRGRFSCPWLARPSRMPQSTYSHCGGHPTRTVCSMPHVQCSVRAYSVDDTITDHLPMLAALVADVRAGAYPDTAAGDTARPASWFGFRRQRSLRWQEASPRVCSRGFIVPYAGGIVRIAAGARYFVDSQGGVLVGWHGSTDPPVGMDGSVLIPEEAALRSPPSTTPFDGKHVMMLQHQVGGWQGIRCVRA